jgi:hypothetical protein
VVALPRCEEEAVVGAPRRRRRRRRRCRRRAAEDPGAADTPRHLDDPGAAGTARHCHCRRHRRSRRRPVSVLSECAEPASSPHRRRPSTTPCQRIRTSLRVCPSTAAVPVHRVTFGLDPRAKDQRGRRTDACRRCRRAGGPVSLRTATVPHPAPCRHWLLFPPSNVGEDKSPTRRARTRAHWLVGRRWGRTVAVHIRDAERYRLLS